MERDSQVGQPIPRRFDRLAWRGLPPEEPARVEYARLEDELRRVMRTAKEARAGANYLYHFVVLHRRRTAGDGGGPPDPDCLRTASLEDIVGTWEAMRAGAMWGPGYLRDVRTTLSRALLGYNETAAHVVNPGMYRGRCNRIHVNRSVVASFTIHECLPRHVRQSFSPTYHLLSRIGERMLDCLASVSKAHMQTILGLVDHLLHAPPGLWAPGCTLDVEERWAYLRGLTARAWLQRYADVFFAHDPQRRIGFDLFKRHIRYLSHLHGRVLNPTATARTIPVPSAHRVTASARPGADDDDDDGSSVGFGSSGATTEADNAACAERHELLGLLGDMRQRFCRPPPSPVEQASRVFAFSPAEVRRMVELACTTQEQLMVVLLLTTGLRIGGLARLQLPGPAPRTAAEVPRELVTTEKNNTLRRILPSECCRVLLARWYSGGRRTTIHHPDSPYVFPCPQGRQNRPVSTRYVWGVCRGLFERAGLRGDHCHPHTFRHTVVQMLFMARWVPGLGTHRASDGVQLRDDLQVAGAQQPERDVHHLRAAVTGGHRGQPGQRPLPPPERRGGPDGVAGSGAVPPGAVPLQRAADAPDAAHQPDEVGPGGPGGVRRRPLRPFFWPSQKPGRKTTNE